MKARKKRLPSRLFCMVCIVFLIFPSCKEREPNDCRHSPGKNENNLYKVSYSLSATQQGLVRRFVERYSSTVDELLSSAGIGYIGEKDSEIFRARIEGEQLIVIGDEASHLKIEKFLNEYFDEEYLENLFSESDTSRREWGNYGKD